MPMRAWLAVLALAIAQPLAATVPLAPPDPANHAQALLDAGRFDEAAAMLDAAIPRTPEDPRLFVVRGRLHLLHGTLQEAQRSYAEASRLDPTDARARRIADSLARKADVKAYAEGVEAFQNRAWGRARSLLQYALDRGNLGPEHTAIAQQYLVTATFAQARVAEEIRRVQAAREAASQAYLARRVSPGEVARFPASNPAGSPVNFVGKLLERRDDAPGSTELVVTMRAHASLDALGSRRSFSVFTPAPLPPDPRLGRGALVEVTGRLIDPPERTRPFAPRVAVAADRLVVELDEPGRGLAGPLRVDYLRYTAEQLENLPPGSR